MSGIGKIESAQTEGQAALLLKSSIPALLDIARKKDKDLELLFAILWSIKRSAPRIAPNHP